MASMRLGNRATGTSRTTASPVDDARPSHAHQNRGKRHKANARPHVSLLPVDIDAFAAAHRAEWQRLDDLVRRRRRLSGAEVDELVQLYQQR